MIAITLIALAAPIAVLGIAVAADRRAATLRCAGRQNRHLRRRRLDASSPLTDAAA